MGAGIDDFRFSAPIEIPQEEASYFRLVIGPEVWATARDELADLRMFDAEGNDVPFAIVARAAGSAPAKSIVVQPDEGVRAGDSGWILHLAVPDDLPVLKRLCLETTTSNFYYNASLESWVGGEVRDRIETSLYNLAPHVRASDLCIDIPDWQTRHLRLRLEPTDDVSVRRIDVDLSNVQGSIREHSSAELRVSGIRLFSALDTSWGATEMSVRLKPVEAVAPDTEGSYRWSADQMPLERIELEIADPHFSRPFVVRGTDLDHEVIWERSGLLERKIGTARAPLAIRLPGIPAAAIELTVDHGRNRPLTISQATGKAVQREVIFLGKHEEGVRLAWGHPTAKPANFDLQHVLPRHREQLDAFPLAALGEVQRNPNFQIGSADRFRLAWDRFGLPLLTVLLVGGLGTWLWVLLRRPVDDRGNVSS